LYAFAVTLRSQLSRPWDCALAINRAARSACRSAASRRRPLLSPPTHVAVVLKLLMRGNRKIIGCCSSICPFSVNWKSFFQSIGRDLLNELQCRSGTLVSGWILVLLIKLLAPPLAFYVRGHGVFEWRPHKGAAAMGSSVFCRSTLGRSGRAAEYPPEDPSDFCLLRYRQKLRSEQMPPDHPAINRGSWTENRPLLDWVYTSSTDDPQAGCTKVHTSPECSRWKVCSSARAA
jgi:hypothetical protein